MRMRMVLVPEDKVKNIEYGPEDFRFIAYDWKQVIDVKYVPTGEIQSRKICEISIDDDMVQVDGQWCSIVSALSY